MQNTIQLKIEFEGSLRRVSIAPNDSFAKLKQTLATLLGISQFGITYRDEEGDYITINSDVELKEVLDAKNPTKLTRLIVLPTITTTTGSFLPPPPPKETTPPPPPPPKLPFEDVARLLADFKTVQELQQDIFSSPILTEAINQASEVYLSTKGDLLAVLEFAKDQWPLLQAVVLDVLEKHPVLLEAFQQSSALLTSRPLPFPLNIVLAGGPMSHYPFNMAQACAAAHVAPNTPNGDNDKHVHRHVLCDGCTSNEELKHASLRNGHMGRGRGGYIRGLRFKSQKVPDFDLCETCYGSKEFEAQCGPFVQIESSPRRECGGRRRWHQFVREEAPPAAAAAAAPTLEKKETATTKEEDEWVKVQDDLMKKWASQLQILATLGLEKMEKYVTILEEEHGDLEKTVNRIFVMES